MEKKSKIINVMNREKDLIDLQPLIRMKDLLAKSLTRLEAEKLDELGEMGIIQAFEVSYELVWKTLQKILNKQGIDVYSPRETFRLAAQSNYLTDPKVWFDFGKERNLTTHTYQEEIVTHLLNFLPSFVKELTQFITHLQTKEEEIN